jgi:hypothetical protein
MLLLQWMGGFSSLRRGELFDRQCQENSREDRRKVCNFSSPSSNKFFCLVD